jgi:hypothetical protein
MSYEVKNLKNTSGCPHYQDVSGYGNKGCFHLGCNKGGKDYSGKTFRCHVIMKNQNSDSAIRYIVPMCVGCNQLYGMILYVDGRVIKHPVPNCKCGNL